MLILTYREREWWWFGALSVAYLSAAVMFLLADLRGDLPAVVAIVAIGGDVAALGVYALAAWIRRVRRQGACWHHDRTHGHSWIDSHLINAGMGKMFWCRNCDRTWFV